MPGTLRTKTHPKTDTLNEWKTSGSDGKTKYSKLRVVVMCDPWQHPARQTDNQVGTVRLSRCQVNEYRPVFS